MLKRTLVACAMSTLGAGVLLSAVVAPAQAHGIIDLQGTSAVAGQSSVMTLEIQHGCLPSEPTVQVEAFVGSPWRAVKPQAVPGWTSRVTRQTKGGWHITWVNQGTPIPFGTATYFPISVAWPSKPGTYGMSVMQLCPGSSYYWNSKNAPATADTPSPPLTPRPEVLVIAAKDVVAATPKAKATPSVSAHLH